jgi:methylmalonyl-CoA mutase
MTVATATKEIWTELVERTLRGASLDKLISRSADELPIEPLYDASSFTSSAPLRAPGRWRVAQRLDHPDPKEASALARSDLGGGVEEIALSLSGAPTAHGFGVDASLPESFDLALADIDLGRLRLRLETAPFDGRSVAELMLGLVTRRGSEAKDLSIDFGLDPVSDMARMGGLPLEWPALSERFFGTVELLRQNGFTHSLARVDGRAAHEAAASEAQELAFVLATGVAYLRLLEAKGLTLDEARRTLSFLLVADADEFLSIAKFRAMRRLWAKVEKACGLAPQPIDLSAETAWRMMTRRDPYGNILRATLAAFSAGIGGADSITVLPFTAAIGLPDAFARRVARNLQHVLIEESQLWRVADAAAGSGAFEALTEALAHKAWELFQEIEGEGGIIESLMKGRLQQRIAAVRARRDSEIARRKVPITGVSQFALLSESVVAVLTPEGGRAPARAYAIKEKFEALPSIRFAEAFERLRDRSDAHLARTGRRPRVFLANLGGAATFMTRRNFAKSLFEGGGIETVENERPATLIGIVDAFRGSHAPLACLCSSDEVYLQQGVDAARALREAGAAKLAIAGQERDLGEALSEARPDFYLFAGCDALSLLNQIHDELFVAKG